jgi:Fe-S-cluster containining protein
MPGRSTKQILKQYQALLEELDTWFSGCIRVTEPGLIRCAAGCSACCRGLFDITLLDARLLQEGFRRLPGPVRATVLDRARPRLAELEKRWPDFGAPYLLNYLPDSEWTEMPEDDETPCPLLGEDGRCLVYAWRPMTCRLHGLPNIDVSGESFADTWCNLNFVETNPLLRLELRWGFRDNFAREILLFREFSSQLLGFAVNEWDTFIPTALFIDFTTTDWPMVFQKQASMAARRRVDDAAHGGQ